MSESYIFYLRNYSLETIKMIRNPIKYKIYLQIISRKNLIRYTNTYNYVVIQACLLGFTRGMQRHIVTGRKM